ncbi:electron transfer flavoprotein subunit alpha/FixB family protein [Mesorhizobium shangrilense]|uniref:Electron transfer flavoprotein subunit alpha/FixB family protein n=1 Tax=Mesorhizobium shangrilense TaxID=460060 RepID=A0ABV2DLR5_9HYPH
MSGILIVSEHLNGRAARISKEIVGAANALKSGIDGPLRVLMLSDGDEGPLNDMNLEGVDEIVIVNVGSAHFDASIYEDVTIELSKTLRPSLILFGHTANGMACAASVAARLGTGYASDIIGMKVAAGKLIATRSAHGGKINLDLAFPDKRVVTLTIRGATFKAPDSAGHASVVERESTRGDGKSHIEHVDYIDPPAADIDIAKAEIILSVGRGIQNADNIPRFAAIAEKLGVTLGCSRPFADAGFLPKAHQVGQSGTVASNCKLYIAIGISGAVQHLYGMKHIDTIIAVNNDPGAPIFGFAKFGSNVDSLALADALEAKLGLS